MRRVAWRAPHSRVTVETPAFVVPTCRGFVPHLTSSVLATHVGGPLLLQAALEDVVDGGAERFAAARHPAGPALTSYCAWPAGTTVVVTAESAAGTFDGPRTTAKRCVVRTRTGHTEVTPARFADLARALQADLVAFPTNHPAHDAGNKTYDKTINGTLAFADACVLGHDAATLAGVVHVGGSNDKMREWSSVQTAKRGHAAVLLAGVNRIVDADERSRLVLQALAWLPAEPLRIVQGSFGPVATVALVRMGLDLVCSSYATDCAARGVAATFVQQPDGTVLEDACIDLHDERYTLDTTPLESSCSCHTCTTTTRAYVHHLLVTHEMLGNTLLAIHNLRRFASLFEKLRELQSA